MTRESQIYRVTLVGGIANVILLVFKFVAGILAHSSAMIADAVHSFSDFATDVIVIFFVRVSSRPQDDDHDYGHGKYETLATTIIGLALLVVAVGIMYSGITKVVHWYRGGQLPSPGLLALWAAVASIVVKELVYQYTIRAGRQLQSQAVIANAWHHRSDALSSIGTAIGISGAVFLGNRWTVLDPIASALVGFFILKVAYDLIKAGVDELMERSLPPDIEKDIMDIILKYPDVTDPHDLRTRRIGSYYAIEVHIRMDGRLTLSQTHDRATAIEHSLRNHYGSRTHVTVHVEPIMGTSTDNSPVVD